MSTAGTKRTFVLLSPFPFDCIRRELAKTGYRIPTREKSRSYFLYYDTQDGKLYKKGKRLLFFPESRELKLIQENEERAVNHVDSKTLLDKGRIASNIGGGKMYVYLPYVCCSLESELFQIENQSSSRSVVAVENWHFHHPRNDSTTGEYRCLTVYTRESQSDVSFLSIILENLSHMHPSDFDPLRWGLEELNLPLPGAPPPDASRLHPGDSILEVGQKILRLQGYKMWANTEGTMLDLDPEFLHDLRVATRRARFALRVLEGIFQSNYVKNLRTELSWIGKLLGRVRDMDVSLDRFRNQFDWAQTSDKARQAVRDHLLQERATYFDPMKQALETQRYSEVIHSLKSPLPEVNPYTGSLALNSAPALIEKRLRRVDRLMKKVRSLAGENPLVATSLNSNALKSAPTTQAAQSTNVAKAKNFAQTTNFAAVKCEALPKELHSLRIAFKGLRYTCEFFGELYGKKMTSFIKSIVAFQDCLGLYQDSIVTQRLLERIIGSEQQWDRESCFSFGALLQIQRNTMRAQLDAFWKLTAGYPQISRNIRLLIGSGSKTN
jgi:CHAD domain-containing protein